MSSKTSRGLITHRHHNHRLGKRLEVRSLQNLNQTDHDTPANARKGGQLEGITSKIGIYAPNGTDDLCGLVKVGDEVGIHRMRNEYDV